MLVVLKGGDTIREFNGDIRALNDLVEWSNTTSLEYAKVTSLTEASTKVTEYIVYCHVSFSCFTGGDVYDDNGNLIARVSYNGRVWDINNKEILFEKTLDIDVGLTLLYHAEDEEYINDTYQIEVAEGKKDALLNSLINVCEGLQLQLDDIEYLHLFVSADKSSPCDCYIWIDINENKDLIFIHRDCSISIYDYTINRIADIVQSFLNGEEIEQPSVSKNIGVWDGLNLENIELYEFMCNCSGGDFTCEPTKELIKMANFIRGKDINRVDVQYRFYVGFDLYDRTVWISSSVKDNVEEECDGYKLPLTDLDKEILLFKIIDELRDRLIDTNQ